MPGLGRAGIVALCLAGLVVNAVTLGPALRYTANGVTDFMPLYVGGRLVFSNDLYTPARQLESEMRSGGWSNPSRLYVRLPCFALFFRALAQLPYPVASAVWEAICVCCMIAFAVLWPARRRWHIALACCWSLPVLVAVAEGQDIGFLMLWIAIAAALVRRNRHVSAGLAASLCLAKFHLFFMIPVWIFARGRWRFASGLLAGCAALLALSFAAGGWNWPGRYYALLREPATNPFRELMPNLRGLLGDLPHAGALGIAGAGVVAVAVWFASRGRRPEWGFAAALAGGILVAPHAFMADCSLLLPALLPLGNAQPESKPVRALCLYLLTPIPWVFLMMGYGFSTRLAMCALVLSLAWQARCASLASAAKQGAGRLLAIH